MINPNDPALKVWEVGGYDPHLKSTVFVLAPSIAVVKQYFYIGNGGFIRERLDVESAPEMRVLSKLPTEEEKNFRAELAARAMQGILAGRNGQGWSADQLAEWSLKYADALMEELNK